MLPMAGEVRSKWEVTSKCFTRKENKERRGILPAAKERPKAKYYFIVISTTLFNQEVSPS